MTQDRGTSANRAGWPSRSWIRQRISAVGWIGSLSAARMTQVLGLGGGLGQQLGEVLDAVEPPRVDREQRRVVVAFDALGRDQLGQPAAARGQQGDVARAGRPPRHDVADHAPRPPRRVDQRPVRPSRLAPPVDLEGLRGTTTGSGPRFCRPAGTACGSAPGGGLSFSSTAAQSTEQVDAEPSTGAKQTAHAPSALPDDGGCGGAGGFAFSRTRLCATQARGVVSGLPSLSIISAVHQVHYGLKMANRAAREPTRGGATLFGSWSSCGAPACAPRRGPACRAADPVARRWPKLRSGIASRPCTRSWAVGCRKARKLGRLAPVRHRSERSGALRPGLRPRPGAPNGFLGHVTAPRGGDGPIRVHTIDKRAPEKKRRQKSYFASFSSLNRSGS